MIQRQALPDFVLVLIFTLILLPLPANSQGALDRVEPPNWWVGMASQNLQLMLHGNDIGRFDAKTSSDGWKISKIHRTDNANYLFIDLLIDPAAQPGDYPIELVADGKTVEIVHYQLQAREKESAQRQGFSAADVVYLITPDRFVNGDYNNDEVKTLSEGVNRQGENTRHGGDIQGVIDSLDYLQKLGISQIWLMPVLQNNQQKSSYHGYSITDSYQVDARFGDNALYRELSNQAKAKGIGLIKDIVLNHIGLAHRWMKDMPSADWINHGNTFVETNHRREALHDPHGTIEDRQSFSNGWFVPTMPDLNQRNPLLANYLIQNSIWWIEFANLSGIRLDTWSYSDKEFLSEYTHRVMQEYPNFNMVGEEWSLNQAIIAYWQRGKKRYDDYRSDLPSLMDFPTQNALVQSLKEQETWSDGLRKLYIDLAGDFIYPDPGNLMVFADNHDMSRIHSQLAEDVALTKMAMAYILTTRGIPQIFYGTEILMANPGTDSHDVIRSEFPGGWRDHHSNALTGKGLTKGAHDMQQFMRALINWRKKTPVVQTGQLTHFAPDDGVYVYFRHNGTSKVMVVMNKNEHVAKIDPAHYASMLEKSTQASDVISGKRYMINQVFDVAARTALILTIED